MHRLARPDFEPWPAHIINPGYLGDALRDVLRGALARSRMDAAKREDFLDRCAMEAQAAHAFNIGTAPSRVAADLEGLAHAARALLHRLSMMQPESVATFRAMWDALAFGSDPPVHLSDESIAMRSREGRFLGAAWDCVADLEAAALYAAAAVTPRASTKIEDELSRAFVRAIAGHFQRLTGRLPPYSKETWFPDFMHILGKSQRPAATWGRKLVESAIRSMPTE